ncbi:MAG: glycosyltransferase [Bacteroidetes bacterium]|nr:glycosyltransferase [Bacteroidota bacterium]
MPNKKVLFIVPYPVRVAPSQRFRVELYEPYMQEAGIEYKIAPFMDAKTWRILYTKGSVLQKSAGILGGFFKRIKTAVFDVPKYNYIFIHREASPVGPPIFEWIIAKIWRKKIIYDYDDAIWLPNDSTTVANKFAGIFKATWKVKYICKWSYKVVGGNDYLCNYARQYNNGVVRIPTCVDMQRGHNAKKDHDEHKVVVGWTGSHTTMFYLDIIKDVLKELQQEVDFTFLVISNKKPELDLKDWLFIKWTEATEVEDLLKMDIGVMPMLENKWSEGKCGFKLIQYLSLGIPGVASPAGVNKIIIEHGVNGYLCSNTEDWKCYLKKLIQDTQLRKQMGKEGYNKMLAEYSIQSQKEQFLNLFS